MVPETKGLTLEELSDVFRIPTARHAGFGVEQAQAFINWCLLRNPGMKMPVLLEKRTRKPEIEELKHGSTAKVRQERSV